MIFLDRKGLTREQWALLVRLLSSNIDEGQSSMNPRSDGWQRRFRPLKDEYSRETYDRMIHVTMRIEPEIHKAMIVELKKTQINRTVWIRQAIEEKLAREQQQS